MDSLSPTVIVVATLIIVAVAALAYQPTTLVGQWRKLADRYAAPNKPPGITFPDEHIMVGRLLGGWLPWRNSLGEYAKFDVELDENGLWLVYDGPLPEKSPPCLFVPGSHIKYLKDKHDQYHFLIHAEPPIPITTDAALGAAIKRRMTETASPIS